MKLGQSECLGMQNSIGSIGVGGTFLLGGGKGHLARILRLLLAPLSARILQLFARIFGFPGHLGGQLCWPLGFEVFTLLGTEKQKLQSKVYQINTELVVTKKC